MLANYGYARNWELVEGYIGLYKESIQPAGFFFQ